MKISVLRGNLLKSLSIVGHHCNGGKLLPILACVKFEVKNGKLRLYCTDNENYIGCRCDILDNVEDIDFCVDYKGLLSYVKAISDTSISLIISDDKTTLSVYHSMGNLEFPLSVSEEFPSMPKNEDMISELSLDSFVLAEVLDKARNFVANPSTNTLRPVMNGICFKCSNGVLDIYSTNSHIMYINSINIESSDFEFILNQTALSSVLGILSESESAKVKVYDKNVVFIGNGCMLSCRLIEGRYPNCRAVVPKDNNITATVNKKALLEAVERASLASDKSGLLKYSFTTTNLCITAQNIDFSIKGNENIPCQCSNDIEINFSKSTTISCVSACDEDEDGNIVFELKETNKAGLFKGNKGHENEIILIMPMQG